MKILHKPLWQIVLLILGIIAGLVYGIHGIILIFTTLAGVESPWYTFTIIDPAIIAVLLLLIYYVADRRFLRVTPSISFAHEFDEGPWLHWREDPKTTITINWFTKSETPTRVAFGKSENGMEVIEEKPGKIHHLTIRNLEPSTRYCYRVLDFEKDGSLHEFKTAPSAPVPVKFIVLGDTQNGGGMGTDKWGYKALMETIKKEDFDLFLITGDATDQGNDLKSWHQFLGLSRLVAANIPMHIAVGNHDTGTRYMMDKGAKNYPDEGANFDYLLGYNYHRPEDEDEITPFQGRYFSFFYGCCYFMILDSQNSMMAEPNNPQWEYIEEQLSLVPDEYWKIVIVHRDLVRVRKNAEGGYYYGYDKFAKYFLPIFDRYGVHAVFQGHAHNLTVMTWKYNSSVPFFDPNEGSREHPMLLFTTGGAGKELRKNEQLKGQDIDLEGFHVQENSTHYLIVDAKPTRIIASAIYPTKTSFYETRLER
ncbi:MAG: metallophosphoesterase [Candidatus Hodarchaeota archaeon]